jgi:hypothetical protein
LFPARRDCHTGTDVHDTRTGSDYRNGDTGIQRLATSEGSRHQHVQAIIVAIDQYVEATTGNRDFFLNKPPRLLLLRPLGIAANQTARSAWSAVQAAGPVPEPAAAEPAATATATAAPAAAAPAS